MMTVAELIERLQELPGDWQIKATRSGRSLEFWNPDGSGYGYVFTDGSPTRQFQAQLPPLKAFRYGKGPG